MEHHRRSAAQRRVDERLTQLLDLFRKAYGTLEFAGVGPGPEAARQLEELMDADLSLEEWYDLEVVGGLPTWRRNTVDAILREKEKVGDEFEQLDDPDRGATGPDAGPRTLH